MVKKTITKNHINFFENVSKKSKNDEVTKLREELFAAIVSRKLVTVDSEYLIPDEILLLDEYRSIEKKTLDSVELIVMEHGCHFDDIEQIERMGGRGNNYDFHLSFKKGVVSTQNGKQFLKLELKRGSSIYDQPQLCQYYVTNTKLQVAGFLNYAEFYFDNEYVAEIIKKFKVSSIDRAEYLKYCNTIKPAAPFFKDLKKLKKSNTDVDKYLKHISGSSIHKFLLGSNKNNKISVNLNEIQLLLNGQSDKDFISISVAPTYRYERVSLESLQFAGFPYLKAGRTGLYNTVCVKTDSGAQVEMLLRWKNGLGVIGPAWQIKLTRPK